VTVSGVLSGVSAADVGALPDSSTASDVGALPDSTTASDINAVPQTSTTGAAELPNGTNGDRPTPAAGMLRFNKDTNQFEGYDGTAWGDIGGGAEANNAGAILAAQVFG